MLHSVRNVELSCNSFYLAGDKNTKENNISLMNLTEKEAKEFVHWIIAQLDTEGHKYEYWFDRFLNEVVYPQQKAGIGINRTRHGRKCFKGYNPNLKICHSLCNLRDECKKISTEGFKRCIECARFALSGKKYCYYHQAVKSKNEKRIRRVRVETGLCMGCGKDNDNKNIIAKFGKRVGKPLQMCSKCREHIRNLQALKKSKGAYIHPDLVNKSQSTHV